MKKNIFTFLAAAWGIAGSIKLSIVLYVPAFALLFLPPLRGATKNVDPSYKQALKATAIYGGLIFLTYFIVCFPQSIVLDRPVRFLLKQSAYSTSVDFAALKDWLHLFWEQLHRPLAVCMIALLFFARPHSLGSLRAMPVVSHLRFWAVILIPLLGLISRKVISTYNHYPFPHVAGLLVGGVILTASFLPVIGKGRFQIGVLALLFGLVGTRWDFVPSSLANIYKDGLYCRQQATELERQVLALLKPDDLVLMDPYFPLNADDFENVRVIKSWRSTFDQAKNEDVSLLALNEKYFSRYLGQADASIYVQNSNPDWQKSQQFYRSLANETLVLDPYNQTWIRLHRDDKCGWQVWQRAQKNSQ